MNAVVGQVGRGRQVKGGRVQTVLRVFCASPASSDHEELGERYVGDVLLDSKGRVWRHADTIPADVVLKAMLAHRRQGEACGRLVGLKDGRTYGWFVVSAFETAPASEAA